MGEYDLAAVAAHIQKLFNKERKDPDMAVQIGVGSDLPNIADGACIKMPQWFVDATHTDGFYFGRLVILAGKSDSGKTSAAIMAMRAAQEQSCDVIYVETEGKTTTQDLVNWGVDPDKLLLISSSVSEEAWELLFTTWDTLSQMRPNRKRLIVFDSLGNTISMRDANMDLVEDSSKPGGKGQINRLALNKLIAKMKKDDAAVLFITYPYDNIGSHGQTIAGGTAVNFFSSMSYITSRVKWLEKTVQGKKVRYGAVVRWSLFKNHISKANPGPKEVFLRITADGIEIDGASNKEEDTE